MIGTTISHYKIVEKPPSSTGQVGGGGMSQNGPRLPACRRALPPSLTLRRTGRQAGTLYVSGCRFKDLPLLDSAYKRDSKSGTDVFYREALL